MLRNKKNYHNILFHEEDDDFPLCFAPVLITDLINSREWYVLPRSIHWRNEHFLSTEIPDSLFRTRFRISRKSFFNLHVLLQPYIEKQQTQFRETIASEHRLAIFLYHVTQGNGYTSLTDQFGVGKSTVSKIIGEVSKAIVQHLSGKYIRFSNIDEVTRSMEFWREKTGIPGVVACIDGSHIPISQSANSGTAYCNRKGYYSINVQGNAFPRSLC
jgi:hypothetical protein